MLINKITDNATKVKAVPTKSGNGFTEGKEYVFTHVRNGLYVTTNDNGHIRYDDFSSTSAHLWDGTNIKDMGYFKVTEIINK